MSIVNRFLKPISQVLFEEKENESVYADTTLCDFTATAEDEEVLSPVVEEAVQEEPICKAVFSLTEEKPATDIKSYFALRGVELTVKDDAESIAPVEAFAMEMANQYTTARPFIQFVRECIVRKRFRFTYSYEMLSREEQESVLNLVSRFNTYGIISNVFVNRQANTISGVISTAPRVTNFINGDFLELYAQAVTKRVIEEMAEEYGCDSELYRNAFIFKDEEKHELDLVFRVGEQVFWAEVKSGKFSDFDCYRKLGMFLDVNPDRHILLTAEKSDEVAQTISWFYQYYVANIRTFELNLRQMIANAFGEER